ncbi:MAG: O-antigen ligase family protein [Candidatus Omnitrophica bacterium]|nr:O-antigen ligase family protein [Candidatus Omnitrophota bacterium]
MILAAYLASTAIARNPQNSSSEILRFISYSSMFFLVSRLDSKQQLLLIKTAVVISAAISIYTFYQYFVAYPWVLDNLKRTNSAVLANSSYVRDILISKRAVGTFPSPNMLGGYLLMFFFLSLHLIKNERVSKKWSVVPALIAVALTLTKSIGAWLSLTACLLILLFISSHPFKAISNIPSPLWVGIGRGESTTTTPPPNLPHKGGGIAGFFTRSKFFLIITIFFIGLVLTFMIISRGERMTNFKDHQNPVTQRIGYWITSAKMIKDHPLLGVGPGNFQTAALTYKAHPAMADAKFAHNIFLHYFAETGLLGFSGVLLLFIAFIRSFSLETKFLFLAGASFLFHNLIDYTFFISQVGMFWWVIWGLMESSRQIPADG